MSKRTYLLLIGSLLLGLLLGVFFGFKGGVGIKAMTETTQKNSEGIPSVRGVEITIAPSQREVLFTQLQKFAEENAFAIRIAQFHPSYESFAVDLWRDDIWATGLYSNDPETLSLGFYHTVQSRPVSESVFDEVVSNLESYINEIQGATFSIKK